VLEAVHEEPGQHGTRGSLHADCTKGGGITGREAVVGTRDGRVPEM